MTVLSLEDLKAVIGESGLPNREELLAGLDAYDGHEPTLGFSFGMVKCELCGYEELIIYPVPMRMPCECGRCGQPTSYFMEDTEDTHTE